jgi:hypothetical protein
MGRTPGALIAGIDEFIADPHNPMQSLGGGLHRRDHDQHSDVRHPVRQPTVTAS